MAKDVMKIDASLPARRAMENQWALESEFKEGRNRIAVSALEQQNASANIALNHGFSFLKITKTQAPRVFQ